MKKVFFTITILIFAFNAQSQWDESNVPGKITTADKVGIGTKDLGTDKLRIATGGQYFRVTQEGIGVADNGWRNTFYMTNHYDYHELYSNQGKPIVFQLTKAGAVGIGTKDLGTDKLRIATGGQYFRVTQEGIGVADNGWRNTFYMTNHYDYHELYSSQGKPIVFQLTKAGAVGIGTSTTGTHKLAVDGSIGAKEIKVETEWSDFVFDEDYELKSIEEVEQYIKENGHLSEIPDQETVEKDGVNLGEMNAKLLQKIEELTLYMIDINKQLKSQNEHMEQLEQENLKLQKEVSVLKNK